MELERMILKCSHGISLGVFLLWESKRKPHGLAG